MPGPGLGDPVTYFVPRPPPTATDPNSGGRQAEQVPLGLGFRPQNFFADVLFQSDAQVPIQKPGSRSDGWSVPVPLPNLVAAPVAPLAAVAPKFTQPAPDTSPGPPRGGVDL
jgi:hypothetical protein